MRKAWVGVDTGKAHHWAVAVDADGRVLWSQRVANDQAKITDMIGQAARLANELTWAVDLSNCYAVLLLGLLWDADQPVVYLPGKAVNRAADAYRSEGKTDARDARVIADQARMRRDLQPLTPSAEVLAELRLLITHRRDLVTDRTRMITRLREHLTAIFPALERRLDLTRKGPLMLLCGYQTPQAIRAAGPEAITAWLRDRKVLKAQTLAQTALAAAASQTVRLPAAQLTAQLTAELAGAVLAVDGRITELDKSLQTRLERHPKAEVLTSLPGMGTLLAAEFLVAVGDLAAFPQPRPPGRLRRPGPGPARVRQAHRWPVPAPALQPRPAAGLLHLRIDQRPAAGPLAGLLPAQTRRGQAAHPGGAGLGPPAGQRLVGHAARPPGLHHRPANRSTRRLTESIGSRLLA
jgi:transposase